MTQIAAQETLRHCIEKYLDSQTPQDPYRNANDCWDVPEIRAAAGTRDKVAMKLSEMYKAKNKTIGRVPVDKIPGTSIRYAYGSLRVINQAKPKDTEKFVPMVKVEAKKTHTEQPQKPKPTINVTEKQVTIETETIRIVIEI
jgi:hypothetical protein